jgi:hypothetical protein
MCQQLTRDILPNSDEWERKISAAISQRNPGVPFAIRSYADKHDGVWVHWTHCDIPAHDGVKEHTAVAMRALDEPSPSLDVLVDETAIRLTVAMNIFIGVM